MNMIVKTEDEYEDLLGLWSDLESGLGVILGHPGNVQEFEARLRQYDRWMQDLIKRDSDVGLYLLFQLAINSTVGYSASHALVCAVLCHLIAVDFQLPTSERDSLVRAALTMNIAMTRLQDELSNQRDRPTNAQQEAIRAHATQSAKLLRDLGLVDPVLLETIRWHHQDDESVADLASLAPAKRLAHILHVVDRYAAMISPRESREGRSAAESAQSIIQGVVDEGNEVGQALVRIVGFCPPGTYVQLDDDKVAVVMRRSVQPNLPDVAIVINDKGHQVKPPSFHQTAHGSPTIKAALSASVVQERINHHVILQLGTQAA
jgi:HD-GYP domain-containing protein (c-di-GMP phosphodiesterase class II)